MFASKNRSEDALSDGQNVARDVTQINKKKGESINFTYFWFAFGSILGILAFLWLRQNRISIWAEQQ